MTCSVSDTPFPGDSPIPNESNWVEKKAIQEMTDFEWVELDAVPRVLLLSMIYEAAHELIE